MRLYSSIAQPTTLATGISNSDTTISVMATVGYPAISPGNTFTVALDYGGATEELVDVTAVAGNVWTVTRGVDGTSAQSHSGGAVVRHTSSGRDFADMQSHITATTGVHGVTGALVGTTNTQTLSNKTLSSPTIASGALSGTFTGSPQFSGATEFTGNPVFQGAATADMAASVRVAADAASRLALRADGALLWGDGASAADVTLARSGAGAASLTASLAVSGAVTGASTVGTVRTNTTDVAFQEQLSGDSAQRWTVGGDGKLSWGPGNTSTDTTLYRSASGVLKTDGSLTTGGDLVAGGVGQVLFAIKTSDTTRANTSASAPDPHLQLSLSANATYEISGLIVYGGSAAGGIQMDWDGPASTDGWWLAVLPSTSASTPTGPVRVAAAHAEESRTYGWVDDGSGTPFGAHISAIITTSSAIAYRFLWAQATSNAAGTTVYAKSFIRARRLA